MKQHCDMSDLSDLESPSGSRGSNAVLGGLMLVIFLGLLALARFN